MTPLLNTSQHRCDLITAMSLALFAIALIWVAALSEQECSSCDDDGAVSCAGSQGSFAIGAQHHHSSTATLSGSSHVVSATLPDVQHGSNTGQDHVVQIATYRIAPKTSPPVFVVS